MEFIPLRNNIVISFIETGEETSAILLPSEYRPTDTPYEVVRVVGHHPGPECDVRWVEEDLVVVEAHMIRQFEYDGVSYHLIAENHVIGRFANLS